MKEKQPHSPQSHTSFLQILRLAPLSPTTYFRVSLQVVGSRELLSTVGASDWGPFIVVCLYVPVHVPLPGCAFFTGGVLTLRERTDHRFEMNADVLSVERNGRVSGYVISLTIDGCFGYGDRKEATSRTAARTAFATFSHKACP